MPVLGRKLARDLWRMRGQAVATALVVASGVATVLMTFGTTRSLEVTRDAYYERYRFADVFAGLKRAPVRIADRIARIPGVKRVETRIVKDVTLDVSDMEEPATARLVSRPSRGRPALNDVTIRRGRDIAPGRPNEVLVSEAFARAHGLGPGDRLSATINGRKRRLVIVGVALSPEYVYSIGPGVLVPDDRRFGVVWMARKALAASFDLESAFNDVSLALAPTASAPAVIERLDDLLAPYGGVGAYERADQTSHAYLAGEMDQLVAVGRIVPPIFLAVAAFLLNVVVSRQIDTEREQIGLLKAFGYTNAAIGWHYLKFALAVVVLGVAGGWAAGAWLGRLITELYTQFFQFPFLYFHLEAGVFAGAALVSLAAGVAGTFGAVRRAASLPPAVAMRPAPPTLYRRGGWDALGIMRFAAEPTRMILRHIGRWPIRSALTTLGIAMAVAILVGTLFFYDAIDQMIAIYFHQAQRQDVTVVFVEPLPERALDELRRLPGVMAGEPFRAVPARLRLGPRAERVTIVGLDPGTHLRRMVDRGLRAAEVPERGLVLSNKLAEMLGARRGERLTVEILEGRRPVRRIAVSAVVEEYIGTPAYMDRRALNRLMREPALLSGAYLQVDERRSAALYRRLKDMPGVAGVQNQRAALYTFRRTMAESLDIIITFYVAFSGLIAFGVLYNSARIALSERAHELAGLRVLGFTRGEVSYILLGELAMLTLVALPLGSVIGYGMAALMSAAFDNELFRVPLVVAPATYGLAVTTVLAAALLSGVLVRRRLDRLDLVAVLKTRE